MSGWRSPSHRTLGVVGRVLPLLLLSALLAGLVAAPMAQAQGAPSTLRFQYRKAEVEVAAHPRDPRAWLRLGTALLALDRLRGAEAAFRHAMSLDPHWAPPVVGLAETYEAEGDLQNAMSAYYRALVVDRTYLPAWLGAIHLLQATGDRRALSALARAGLGEMPALRPIQSTLRTVLMNSDGSGPEAPRGDR